MKAPHSMGNMNCDIRKERERESVCVLVYVHACVHACVCACMRMCVCVDICLLTLVVLGLINCYSKCIMNLCL